MSDGFSVVRDRRLPRVLCPGCGAELGFDVMPFRHDPNLMVRGACPACGRTLYAAILIPVSLKAEELSTIVEAMVKASGVTAQRLLRRKRGSGE